MTDKKIKTRINPFRFSLPLHDNFPRHTNEVKQCESWCETMANESNDKRQKWRITGYKIKWKKKVLTMNVPPNQHWSTLYCTKSRRTKFAFTRQIPRWAVVRFHRSTRGRRGRLQTASVDTQWANSLGKFKSDCVPPRREREASTQIC